MEIYCIRSDQGDGGWSLHAREMEDEEGIAPVLVSGTAVYVDYEWSRPNADDYAAAKAAALDQQGSDPADRA